MRKIISGLAGWALLCLSLSAQAQFVGDYPVGTDNICRYFTTYQPSTGAAFTIVSEAVDVYSDDSATQDSDDSGLTLDDDFDSVTGFHQICVDTSSDGTFYSAGKTFTVMLSGGTVDSVSVVGTPILSFTLAKGVLSSGAITATVIAADAIGASELATDAIGSAEVAAGAIAADAFASGAIDATAIAADAIGASELATDAIGAAEIAANAVAAAEVADGAIDSATFATTAGSFYPLGIIDQGTAQAAGATTIQLRSAATFADDELNGAEVLITGGSAGVGQTRLITDYVASTDTATVATWTTTPSGTVTYMVFTDTATGGSVSIGVGGIAANSFAAGAIDATAIAADAIGASEIADNAIDAGALAADAITDAEMSDTAGAFYALGVIDQGTAQNATSTELVLRSAASFANDEVIGATCLITGGSTGVGQSRTVTDYDSASDTATVDAWTTTPTGTITYRCFGTAPGAAGSGATAAEVWGYAGTRSLTVIDEDSTTLDLNATIVGGLTTLDEDSTTLDLNATIVGGLTTLDEDSTTIDLNATPVVTGSITDGAITAADFAAGAIDASAIAAGAIGASELATDSITSDELGATGLAEITADSMTTQRILFGTCDSGSTTTCVDDALTQAAESQIDDRLICFDDSWCGLITGFTPGSDTVTTTKTAPSTRSAKAYTIFPATQD